MSVILQGIAGLGKNGIKQLPHQDTAQDHWGKMRGLGGIHNFAKDQVKHRKREDGFKQNPQAAQHRIAILVQEGHPSEGQHNTAKSPSIRPVVPLPVLSINSNDGK